jgi:hypothetical protein
MAGMSAILLDSPQWEPLAEGLDSMDGKYLWIIENGKRHGDYRIDIVVADPSGPEAGKYAVRLVKSWVEGGGWTGPGEPVKSGQSKSQSWYLKASDALKAKYAGEGHSLNELVLEV